MRHISKEESGKRQEAYSSLVLTYVPSIFQSLCVHKISVVQHFSRTPLYLKQRVQSMCKIIFGTNICVRSKFSCVRSSHGLCACAHVHSLEGTLVLTIIYTGMPFPVTTLSAVGLPLRFRYFPCSGLAHGNQ